MTDKREELVERVVAYFRRQGGQCNAQQPVVPVAGSELLKAADLLEALGKRTVEPTEVMRRAADDALNELGHDPVTDDALDAIYTAMIAASRDTE